MGRVTLGCGGRVGGARPPRGWGDKDGKEREIARAAKTYVASSFSRVHRGCGGTMFCQSVSLSELAMVLPDTVQIVSVQVRQRLNGWSEGGSYGVQVGLKRCSAKACLHVSLTPSCGQEISLGPAHPLHSSSRMQPGANVQAPRINGRRNTNEDRRATNENKDNKDNKDKKQSRPVNDHIEIHLCSFCLASPLSLARTHAYYIYTGGWGEPSRASFPLHMRSRPPSRAPSFTPLLLLSDFVSAMGTETRGGALSSFFSFCVHVPNRKEGHGSHPPQTQATIPGPPFSTL